MNIFQRGKLWWARIPRLGAPGVQRSLGTQDKEVAMHIARFLDHCKATRGVRESWLLTEMAEGRVPVLEAYYAYTDRKLDLFIEQHRFGPDDPELEPWIETWVKEMIRRKTPSEGVRRKYEQQVRTFITEGFRRSQLTRPNIRRWLQDLPVGQPNRYRAALSSFCRFLVLEEVLEHNPVAGVPATQEAAPRDRHLTPDEALALVKAMPTSDDRAFQALLICTAADVESARQVRIMDVGGGKVYIRGTKQQWRTRYCYIYKRWEPVWAIFAEWFRGQPPVPAREIFQRLGSYDDIYHRFRAACRQLGIEDYTMKDHRHTWAVQAFKDKLPIHAIYQQLGHRDATMALKVYGKHTVRAEDYEMDEELTPA